MHLIISRKQLRTQRDDYMEVQMYLNNADADKKKAVQNYPTFYRCHIASHRHSCENQVPSLYYGERSMRASDLYATIYIETGVKKKKRARSLVGYCEPFPFKLAGNTDAQATAQEMARRLWREI